MPRAFKRIGVFLSSPGDLANERIAVAEVCSEITLDHGRHDGFFIDLIRLETHGRSAKGDYAQNVINDQLGDDYDIYLGMLWSRFGTPTRDWQSGTEEEFRIAHDLNQKKGKPELMFFFSGSPVPPLSMRPDQLASIQAFKTELERIGLLYWTFQDTTDLKVLIRRQLLAAIREILRREGTTDTVLPSNFSPVLSDPLANFRNLVDSDPEVKLNSLIAGSVDGMKSFTSIMQTLADDVKRLGLALTKAAAKIVTAQRSKPPSPKGFLTALNESSQAMATYSRRLAAEVPKLHDSFESSINHAHRVVEFAAIHVPYEMAAVPAMTIGLNNLKQGLEALSEKILPVNEMLRQSVIGLPKVDTEIKKVGALHDDLLVFVKRGIALIDDLNKYVSTVEKRTQDR